MLCHLQTRGIPKKILLRFSSSSSSSFAAAAAATTASTADNVKDKSAVDVAAAVKTEPSPAEAATAAPPAEDPDNPSAIGSHEVLVETPTTEAFHIQCDACQAWYDATELDPPLTPASASQYETWHCEDCIPYHGPSQHKRSRSGLRQRRRIDFVKLNDPASLLDDENGCHIGVAANDVQEIDFKSMLRQRQKRGMFKGGLDGCLLSLPPDVPQFDAAYAERRGFDQPVLIADRTPQQIGLRLPPPNDDGSPFTFANVAELVGPYRTVQVIDTATQLTTEYTLQEWVDYLHTPTAERTRTLNVITLEFSQTPLGRLVTEPQFARQVDFVMLHWPRTAVEAISSSSGGGDGNGAASSAVSTTAADALDQLEELEAARPRVSKYCLMSAGGSWTDFHVDFGGTAVWYHLFHGTKIFYFIKPTRQNLKIYSDWATNKHTECKGKKQTFLPDLITSAGGSVYEVIIHQGQTLLIPSGWIHAVYTPFDSLVFGGNFVHRHSLEMQLCIYRLERQMKVGKEFRFPNYMRLMWYAARDFLQQCIGHMPFTPPSSQQRESEGGIIISEKEKAEQRRINRLCSNYSPHILKGYWALAKELERWSTSKTKRLVDQYPPGMDVVAVASQLSRIMNQCVIHIESKDKDRIRREREQSTKKKRKEEREKARAKAEVKRIKRLQQQQVRKEEAERKRAERLQQQQVRKEEEERKRAKREMAKATRILERRKDLESQYDEIAWAQCDRCNEWREVPLEVIQRNRVGDADADDVEERPFFCSDIEERCKDNATEWIQCVECMAWHEIPRVETKDSSQTEIHCVGNDGTSTASHGVEAFLCKKIGKKCCAKKFMRANLALSG